ncbi:hypothetical protein JL720_6202 [Aureococcus anophagefferens]|nr:hypothetical protein JL720_6202 [Aureococcus anophagefferens]
MSPDGTLREKRVCVAVRCRPLSARELGAGSGKIVSLEQFKKVVVSDPVEAAHREGPGWARAFAFDATGSGKTFSMLGGAAPTSSLRDGGDRGLIPRVCCGLFDAADAHAKSHDIAIEASYMEIYNETVASAAAGRAPRVRERRATARGVPDLTVVRVANREELVALLQVTGTDGARLREAKSINRSLATLCDVIEALAANSRSTNGAPAKPRFVPYRNSALTWLLKDSLGGNAFATMLATVSPSEDHYEETLATLKYAARARKVRSKASVNAVEDLPSESDAESPVAATPPLARPWRARAPPRTRRTPCCRRRRARRAGRGSRT